MPPALLAVYDDVPLWIDFRDNKNYDLAFRAEVARLAAPIHGMNPEDVTSEDLDLSRRGRRLLRLATLGLLLLAVTTTIRAILASRFARTHSADQHRPRSC